MTLNGLAGSDLTITITTNPTDNTFTFTPTTLTIPAQQSSATFTVTTQDPDVAQLTVYANMAKQGNNPAGQVSAILLVDNYNLTSFTLDNSEIPSGGTANGTVSIGTAAPAGGVIVDLVSSNPLVGTVSTPVLIPQGQTSVTFPINGLYVAQTSTTTITASRSGQAISAVLTVDPLTFNLQLTPSDLLGGGTAEGLITLNQPAPPAGITLTLSADPANLATLTPTSVFIAGGATTTTTTDSNGNPYSFLLTTGAVITTTNVNISAFVEGCAQSG